MRALVLELDALPTLREAMSAVDVDLAAAATLAELAGVDAVRLGVTPDLKPVCEEDLQDMRRAARRLELRLPPSEMLLPVALATQPDQVLLAADALRNVSPDSGHLLHMSTHIDILCVTTTRQSPPTTGR